MKNIYYKITVGLLFLANTGFAQLTTATGASPTDIANTLSGTGITISNVQIRCEATQYATFTGAASSGIGLTQGLLLTTGMATNIGSSATTFLSTDVPNGVNPIGYSNVGAQFPVLANILPSNSSVNDVCEVSFDLIPNCSLINLNYVFASDEYPIFSAQSCPPVSNSIYDVFAFVIDGPNPSGGSYVNQNLAFVPGTSQPVTIHSVSPYCNSNYYVNNQSGTSFAYGGYTTPFTAAVDVIPCQTYTMKLQIADGGDSSYDSGVFIEYKSFACANSVINTSPNKIVCPLQPTIITASNASSYTWATNPPTPITYINPSTIVIAPAVTTTVTVSGYAGCTASTQTLTSKKVLITVNPPTDINLDNTYTKHETCDKSNGRIRVSSLSNGVVGGYSPYSFDFNNTGVFSANRTFTGLSAGTYTITVKDSKGCTTSKDFVINNTPGVTTYTKVIKPLTCNLNNGEFEISSVVGGTAPYTYTFNNNTATTNNSITGLTSHSNYKITIVDANGCEFLDSVNIIKISAPEKIFLTAFKDTCALSKGKVEVDSVRYGSPPFTYYFGNSTIGTTNASISNLHWNNEYIVRVIDTNNCVLQDTIKIRVIAPPSVDAGVPQTVCVGNEIILSGQILGGATSTLWETTGLGLIENPTALNTKYIPDASEQTDIRINFTLKSIDHFPACDQAISVTNVGININPIASIPLDSIKACLPFVANISNNSTGNITDYKWYLDDTYVNSGETFSKEFIEEGTHSISLVVTTPIGCADSIFVKNKIIAVKQPNSNFIVETSIPLVNEVTSFLNSSINADSYIWNFGDDSPLVTTQHADHIYEIAKEYDVSLIANEKTKFCIDTSVVKIIVNPSLRVYIPTSFSPNGDGINDVFKIMGQGIYSPNLQIYNRWGVLVFQSTDSSMNWDGKANGKVLQDAYVYKLKVKDISGSEFSYSGTVTVLQ